MRYEWDREKRTRMEAQDFIKLSQNALDRGEPMLALDIANTGLKYNDKNLKLRQLASLAYSRSGSPARAASILETAFEEGQRDAETCGLLGSAFKRLWERTENQQLKELYGKHSTEYYRIGFENSGSLYCGINCATMNVLQGNLSEGAKFASLAQNLAQAKLAASQNNYWDLVSLAEAYLLQNKINEAQSYYKEALALDSTAVASLITTRTQALKIATHLDCLDTLKSIFELGTVVFCSGHMIDHPSRPNKRFPPELEEQVKKYIDEVLNNIDAKWSYSSAACGTDILFLECMQARGAETNIILPFDQQDFINTSVEFAGEEWTQRFHKVLDKADNVYQTTTTKFLGDEFLFAHCNDFMRGMATMRARVLGSKPNLIAVWDGKEYSSIGGTSEFIKTCDQQSTMIHHIDLVEYIKQLKQIHEIKIEPSKQQNQTTQQNLENRRALKTIIFADFVEFSTLTEEQTPLFVEHCLEPVSEFIKESGYEIDFVNTWGDGLFIVLESIENGAELALGLRDMIRNIDFAKKGLPERMGLRIALHIGPVFPITDPIKNQKNFYGTHIFKAARMEPITTPGCVYCTTEIAALLAIKKPELICEYVGNLPLAKDYGTYPIYQLRRLGYIE